MWKRRGGSFPHFQLALSILSLSSASLHTIQLISPPPLLVCPCQGLKMHVACWLSVCLPGGDRGWSVGWWWFSWGRTVGLHPEEVSSLRSGFSDTGAIFYRDRIKPCSGLDPCFVSSDTEDSHTQGCVYLEVGSVVLSCILLLTTVTHCTLYP